MVGADDQRSLGLFILRAVGADAHAGADQPGNVFAHPHIEAVVVAVGSVVVKDLWVLFRIIFGMRQGFFLFCKRVTHDLFRRGDALVQRHIRGVEQHGIRRRTEGCHGSAAVSGIALVDGGKNFFKGDRLALLFQLCGAAARTRLR